MSIGTATLRRLLAWLMLLVLVASLGLWLLAREPLPDRIRIATAAPGGLYHRVGELLAEPIAARLGRPVEVLVSAGSEQNTVWLKSGEAELALVQGELADQPGLGVLAPLYADVLLVVVRRDAGIGELGDLAGRNVAIGLKGSGMRYVAERLLDHYRIDRAGLGGAERYFGDLAEDPRLEAAIVTTGLLNPDLEELLGSGDFSLLPIPDAAALATRHHFVEEARIPRGFFGERPSIPAEEVLTLATTTVLCAAQDAPGALVEAALAALYEDVPRRELPTLITRQQASEWEVLPRPAAAHAFFQPYSGLGILANLMESLAALKELLFALGAALYLGLAQWRRAGERERQAAMHQEKERLDLLLMETMHIERLQMVADAPDQLRAYLDEVTRIKLRALDELTHEDLRGDVTFGIFLQQCANLTRKIQSKLEFVSRGGVYPAPANSDDPQG